MSEFNNNQSSQSVDTNQIQDGIQKEGQLGKKAYQKARNFYNSKKATQGASAAGKGASASSSGASASASSGSAGASGTTSASGSAGAGGGASSGTATIGGVSIGTILLVIIAVELIFILLAYAIEGASSLKLQSDEELQKIAYEQIQNIINNTYKDNINNLQSAFIKKVNEEYECGASSATHSITQTGGQFTVSTEACSITLNYYPPVEDLSKVIIAQASSINSVISLYTPKEYEKGEWDGVNEMNTQVDSYEDIIKDLQNEEDTRKRLLEEGDKYTSVTNKEFLDDFKSEINTSEILSLKNSEGEYGWLSSVSTNEIEEEVCYLITEEGEAGAEIISSQKVKCEDYSEDEVDKKIEKRKVSSGVINGNIYLNMDNYHRKELKNIAKACASHDKTVTEDDAYKELIKYASLLYEQFVETFGIEDSAMVVVSGQSSSDAIISQYSMSYDGSFVAGTAKKTVDGAIDFKAYADPSGGITSPQTSVTLWRAMETTPGFVTGAVRNNCTYFAAYNFYVTYGKNWTHGDGKDVALNLCAEHPKEFACGMTPAPGGIISTPAVVDNPYGHILFINEVKDDGTVIISDGNVLRYNGEVPGQPTAGMRIMREVNWNSFLQSGVVAVAIPRK